MADFVETAESPDDVAAPDGLPRRSGSLPAQLTTFIGRRKEIVTATAHLDDTRLLTLIGSGGCGKSRLALQVATEALGRYPDGVWWVDLGSVADPALVGNTVAAVLGLQEVPLYSAAEHLTFTLREWDALVVLDNCEHLVDASARLVEKLLRECPSVKVMATSREPLGVEGETAWRVPSLALPPPDAAIDVESLLDYDAIRLFLDRAVKAQPDFRLTQENAAAIPEICRRLDGIPLAIELAAARARVLSAQQIAQGLADRFRLLTGGSRTAVPRQQTLIASVEWSYNLLGEAEKILLRRLAVFSGSFTLDAAEAICTDDALPGPDVLDLLGTLIDKSLLQTEEASGPIRYRMLETIRQYALQKLADADEVAVLRDRHLTHYTNVARDGRVAVEEGPDLLGALDRLDLEHDNLRAALEWATACDAGAAMEIARDLWGYWYSRAFLTEGIARSTAAAAGGSDGAQRARVLASAAVLASTALDVPTSVALADEAVRLARETNDPVALVEAAYAAGSAHFNIDPVRARPPLEEALALAQAIDSPFWQMRAIYGLAVTEINAGNPRRGRELLDEALATSRRFELRLGRLLLFYWRSLTAVEQGDLDEGAALVDEALEEARQVRNVQFECLTLGVGAIGQVLGGHYESARRRLDEIRTLVDAHPHPVVRGMIPYPTELLNYATRDTNAGETIDAAISFFEGVGAYWFAAWVHAIDADCKKLRGDIAGAEAAGRRAIEQARACGNAASIGRAARSLANVRLAVGDPVAESLYHEALQSSVTARMKPDVIAALEGLAAVDSIEGDWEAAARLSSAAANGRAELGAKRFAPDDDVFSAAVENARANLGPEAFGRAWAEGSEMSLESAVAYATRGRGERKRPSTGWKSLTPVETDVVRLVAEGLTNAQIAERLFIAPGTVKNHVSHVFAKLGISTRAELAAEATRRKL